MRCRRSLINRQRSKRRNKRLLRLRSTTRRIKRGRLMLTKRVRLRAKGGCPRSHHDQLRWCSC